MPEIVTSDKKNEVLFALARHVSPALSGQSGTGRPELIRVGQDNTLALQRFYQHLQTLYTSSGKPYWQARGWGMLTWQPLYLSFLSLYCLGSVPSSLGQVAQKQDKDMISGFFLPEGDWWSMTDPGCSLPDLIDQTCHQLRPFYQQLQDEFEQVSGFSASKSQRLTADRVLMTLLRLAENIQRYTHHLTSLLPTEQQDGWHFCFSSERDQRLDSKARFLADARRWLEGLDLPVEHCLRLQEKALSDVIDESPGPGLYLRRLTCCMHYRREAGDLCDNCPRLKKNKAA